MVPDGTCYVTSIFVMEETPSEIVELALFNEILYMEGLEDTYGQLVVWRRRAARRNKRKPLVNGVL